VNLDGWDTVSAVSIEALNEALAAGQERLVTSVEVDQPDVLVSAKLGPWRIRPGVAGAFLNVELPISEGSAERLPGVRGTTDISGMSVVVQIALKLLPAADGKRHELRFDLISRNKPAASVVTLTEVIDPDRRLPDLARALVGQGVAAAVAAHGDNVSYVFASVGGVETSAGWLATSANDWCYVETVDGAAYLAILGAMGSGDELARVVDPAALKDRPRALLAISETALLKGAVLPYLQRSWFKPMKLKLSGGAIQSTHKLTLPKQKSWPFYANPYIDRLRISVIKNALVSVSHGHADMSLGARLDYSVTTTMPFTFDPKTHTARFNPDKSPKVTQTAHLPGVLDTLVGWLVRWIVSLFEDQITKPIQQAAGSIQSVSSPPVQVVGWLGVHFQVTNARLETSLMFLDQSH
jgi:hypothetical protein